MRIITWNCNGAFRRKFESLERFKADIIVIQECEDPSRTEDKRYKEWAINSLWTGKNKNKGLGIFASKSVKLESLDWKDQGFKFFIPCKINDEFNFLGTWCQGAVSEFNYIGQLWKYLQNHKSKFSKSIIAGDFNSNAIWDRRSRYWNHSDVVRELKELEIESFYHNHLKEEQGKESVSTFFLQKNRSKRYHIDYIFGSFEFSKTIQSFTIGEFDDWIQLSDHMPVFCEF